MIEATILYDALKLPEEERTGFIHRKKQASGILNVVPNIIPSKDTEMTDSRATSTAPSITRLADYEVYPFAIDSVNLTFELDPTRTRVTQSSQVRRVVSGIECTRVER